MFPLRRVWCCAPPTVRWPTPFGPNHRLIPYFIDKIRVGLASAMCLQNVGPFERVCMINASYCGMSNNLDLHVPSLTQRINGPSGRVRRNSWKSPFGPMLHGAQTAALRHHRQYPLTKMFSFEIQPDQKVAQTRLEPFWVPHATADPATLIEPLKGNRYDYGRRMRSDVE